MSIELIICIILLAVVILGSRMAMAYYAKKLMRTKAMIIYSTVSVGDVYKKISTSNLERPKYCIIVGKYDDGEHHIIQYNTIMYDTYLRSYDKDEIMFEEEMHRFLKIYAKTDDKVEF